MMRGGLKWWREVSLYWEKEYRSDVAVMEE